MTDEKRSDLDDIISNLNNIREGLTGISGATPPTGQDNHKKEDKPEDEATSLALEEYLASRLQQMGEVTAERKAVTALKTGNGWDANQIVEQVFKIDPISLKRAVEVAVSANRGVKERVSHFFRRPKDDVLLVGTPTVEYIPIWKVKGFHECYFIRTNSYRVNVKEDVVAVEVEGQSRDLILERKHSRLIPAAIVERLQKLGAFLMNESKYFVVGNVLELASKKSDSELVITGAGRHLTPNEDADLTSWRTKRIFDMEDLNMRGVKVNVRDSISKEAVLNEFREEVVKMPERFKQVLSNRLQISELRRVYVPIIKVPMQEGLVPKEVLVNGTSGELTDPKLLELLE